MAAHQTHSLQHAVRPPSMPRASVTCSGFGSPKDWPRMWRSGRRQLSAGEDQDSSVFEHSRGW